MCQKSGIHQNPPILKDTTSTLLVLKIVISNKGLHAIFNSKFDRIALFFLQIKNTKEEENKGEIVIY